LRNLIIFTLLCALAVASAARFAPDLLEAAREQRPKPTVERVERSIARLEKQVGVMEQTADRYAKWKTCVSLVPVNEVGDPDSRFGYSYDERDGTGRTFMPALAVDWGDERPEYAFLRFSRRDGCHSQPTQPGGTAEDASVETLDTIETVLASSGSRASSSQGDKIRALERRLKLLGEREEALRRMSERFDEWESCLSWVPVTEYGDADNRFGYLYGEKGAEEPGYRPAIAVDISEWDDPDYEFLAFVGRDRPFTGRECEGEPGEGVD
jgi:hypothetical protein